MNSGAAFACALEHIGDIAGAAHLFHYAGKDIVRAGDSSIRGSFQG